MSIKLGSALKVSDIDIGDDVYFECLVSANPDQFKVAWSHNVSTVKTILDFFLSVVYR